MEKRLAFKEQEAEVLNEQLKEEEARAKEQLDANITAKQDLEITGEDAETAEMKRRANRDEIIRQQLKKSQLESSTKITRVDLDKVNADNEKLTADNEQLEAANEKLTEEIEQMIIKVDLNTLLKEVDIEEMKLQARNN